MPLAPEGGLHRGQRRLVGFVKDITDQRSLERVVAIHRALGIALATWESFDRGTKTLLRELAEGLGLAAGALLLPRGDALCVRTSWSGPTVDAQRLDRMLGQIRLAKGLGLAGRAWERGQPVAPEPSGADTGFLNRQAAALGGICAAVAFPAVSGGEPLAVVVLYGVERLEPDERLMRALASTGDQLGGYLARRAGALGLTRLTPRELEVLRLASQGLGRQEIEARLFLSTSTVKTHFEHIYAKLGVRSRVAAVATALRAGLIE